MELEEFIKRTLISLYRGVHGANEDLAKVEGKILGKDGNAKFAIHMMSSDSKEGYISFDVAVTVSSKTDKSGSAGIKVLGIDLGGDKSTGAAQEYVSRIKFHIMPWKTLA